MTAPNKMAKRAAAGTLALAVCLGGGVLGAGAANAALPTSGGKVRVTPVDNAQTAPSIQLGQTSAAISSIDLQIPNTWVAGDQIELALSSAATWATLPTVSTKVQGPSGTVAAAGTTAPTFTIAKDPVDGKKGYLKFSNSSTAKTSTTATDPIWETTLSGGTVATAATPAAPSTPAAVTVTITGQSVGSTSGSVTYTNATTFDLNNVTTVAYLVPASITVPASQALEIAGGVQSIGDITFTEGEKTQFTDGDYVLTFTQAGGTVTVDDTTPAGDAFDATFTATSGASALDTDGIVETGDDVTISVKTTSATTVDAFKISGLRISGATNNTNPIKVTLTSIDGVAQTATATNTTTAAYSAVANLPGISAVEDIDILSPNGRLGGADRYATAASILNGLADGTQAVLVSGEGSGVDALSAAYLAGALGADLNEETGVFITRPGSVPDSTLLQLKSNLGLTTDPNVTAANATKTIHILGGTTAVSAAVVAELKAAFPGIIVNRIAGDDRYETAAKAAIGGAAFTDVSSYSPALGKAAVKTAILSSGESTVDALTAGQVTYAGHYPQLLTQKGTLPTATRDAISSLGIKRVVITGGTAAVSAEVATQLTGLGVEVVRLDGADRYETAAKLLDLAELGAATSEKAGGLGLTGLKSTATTAYIANGESFADALVIGPLAAVNEAPALITAKGSLSTATATWLKDSKVSGNKVAGVGLSAALPDATLKAANESANG